MSTRAFSVALASVLVGCGAGADPAGTGPDAGMSFEGGASFGGSAGIDSGRVSAFDEGGVTVDASVGEVGTVFTCAEESDGGGTCPPGLDCVEGADAGVCAPPEGPTITDKGGDVLQNMKLWTVVWTGDEATGTMLDQFTAAAFLSAWWRGAAQYGVAPGQAMGVVVAGPPPASLAADGSDFDAVIASSIGKTTLGGVVVPPPDENTAFGFLIPKQTKATGGFYHTETNSKMTSADGGSLYVPYLVDPQTTVNYLSPQDYLTWSHSHELVETATDPRTPLAWTSTDTGNNEVADLCNDIPVTQVVGGELRTVSRFWSQAIATARSGDPCIPGLSAPWADIGFSPDLVSVPTGSTGATVTLVPFSYGEATPLHWELYLGRGYTAVPAEGTTTPGETVTVTITRDATARPVPEYMQVWVTPPSNPDADVPLSEWFGGVLPSP